MTLQERPIGDFLEPVSNWKQKDSSADDTFRYVDLSSVDQDTKEIKLNGELLVKDAPSRARQILKPNDVLVSTVRPNLNGVAFLSKELDGAIGSTGFCVLRPKPKKLCSRYLFHWVQSRQFVTDMTKKATGQSYPAVSDKIIKESLIPLPADIDEQKRIAAILDQADSLRRARRHAIEKLNTLSQSIFYEMFGDPVTNPKGWDKRKLGDICHVGSSKRVFVSEFVKEGVPFFRGTEVGKLGAEEEIKPELFISSDHYESLIQHSGKPQIGDLLLPSICHDGRIWKVDNEQPFYFKDGRVLWIKNDPSKINSDYLRSYLKQLFTTNYASIASGTTFSELKIINLKNLSLLYPPLELQKKYAEIVNLKSKNLKHLKESLDSCNDLFSSLQQRAFKGEL